MNVTIRFVTTILGLAGLGIIIHEVVRKWQLLGSDHGVLWTIIPLWALFLMKEVTTSLWFQEKVRLPRPFTKTLSGIVSILLIGLAILALASIPLLWFGIIEELARGGGTVR